MKFFKKLKETYNSAKDTIKSVKGSFGKIRKIAQPFLRKLMGEKILFPRVRAQINKRLFLVGSFIGIHVLEFWVNNFFSKSAALENVDADSAKNTILQTTLKPFWMAAGNILVSTAIFSLRRAYIFYIRSSFERDIKDRMAEALLSNNTCSGITYFQEANSGEVLPIGDIFSKHVAGCARGVSMSITLVSDFISVTGNLYTLGRLFNPRLAMVSVVYGISMATIAQIIFGKANTDLYTEVSNQDSEINTRIVNLQQFGQQIVAFHGERLELEKLLVLFRKREGLIKKALKIEIEGELYHGALSRMFTPLLDIFFPELPLLLVSNRAAAYYFNQVLNDVMSRMYDISGRLVQGVPEMIVSVDEVTKFNQLVEKWYHFKKQNLLVQHYVPEGGQVFSIEKLKVHIPDKKKKDSLDEALKILKSPNLLYGKDNLGVNFQFQKGKVYLFPDLSGRGKTTLLKSLLGMYPYTKGKIVYPCKKEEIRFVSRNTFLPAKNTLLEAIIAPGELPKEQEKVDTLIKEVSVLIDDIGMLQRDTHKNNLTATEKTDWLNSLSDGEKQSFAIISILLSEPKILVLDEALGALDTPSKGRVEWIVKKRLSETIILYADHHPIRGFADYAVRIKEGKLVRTDADSELDKMEDELNNMISRNSGMKSRDDRKK